jgi:nucleoside 2-deoxyribosyltransferase
MDYETVSKPTPAAEARAGAFCFPRSAGIIARMPSLYYAAPLFSGAERAWNAANAVALRARFPAAELLVPQEFCAVFDQHPGKPDFAGIYASCLANLMRADAVLAVLDGPDADSGTCFEVGYAAALGVPVVGLRTDWRPAEDGGGNCMLTRSCASICRDLDQAAAALARFLEPG